MLHGFIKSDELSREFLVSDIVLPFFWQMLGSYDFSTQMLCCIFFYDFWSLGVASS